MIIPTQATQYPEDSVISLTAYARHIHACECGFFGVVNAPDCTYSGGCQTIWTKEQRDWVQFYLSEAQHEIEDVLHYFVGRRWVTDEEHPYSAPIQTKWGYVIEGGVKTSATISDSEAVDHSTDPAIIGPVATTVTAPSEIHIYHEDSDLEIIPSGITISGGSVTITVPRCRLVDPDLSDNPPAGLSYSTLSNFASAVDIVREYNVNSNPARLVYQRCQTRTSCTETEASACIYVRKARIGSVTVAPDCLTSCGSLYKVKLNYYAGRPIADSSGSLSKWGRQAMTSIIRLAHAKMPHAPCDCQAADEMWTRDREVIVDGFGRPRRGESPFGPEEGAWAAYIFTNSPGMELVRGATL